ncbi:Hypothetical protein ABZS17D1_02545 [Kosakonia cowanii]
MPRRKQRQLSQKVRIDDNRAETVIDETVAETAPEEQHTQLAKVDLPAVVENAPVLEQEENGEARENTMPRRSRRSPRHLRVSGQRRRRYRDERYPVQSAMPLTIACASPEMASGKVWVRYPVPRAQEEQQEIQHNSALETEQQHAAEHEVAPAVAEAQLVTTPQADVVEPQAPVETAAVSEQPEVVEPQASVAEPAPVEVETTHPEAISAPVDEQPQLIAEEDRPVAEQVAEEAEPVKEEAAPAPVVEDVAPAKVEAPVQAEVPAPVKVEAPVAVKAETAAPVKADAPVVATAPMTKAPAPAYVQEAPRHSDWVRPAFNFDGKGSAGGHSATHTATAPATKPPAVE